MGQPAFQIAQPPPPPAAAPKQRNVLLIIGLVVAGLFALVVVGGIVAAIAIPRMTGFQGKAMQAEAKSSLSNIYVLEQSYFGDNDHFANLADIGFAAQSVRYRFDARGGGDQFLAIAVAAPNTISKGCDLPDVWAMDQNKQLLNPSDAVKCQSDGAALDALRPMFPDLLGSR